MGMKVEVRPVPVEELATFEEVGACGTAAVISPVKAIVDDESGTTYQFGSNDEPGPWSKKLYERLMAIQTGELPDPYGWVEVVK